MLEVTGQIDFTHMLGMLVLAAIVVVAVLGALSFSADSTA